MHGGWWWWVCVGVGHHPILRRYWLIIRSKQADPGQDDLRQSCRPLSAAEQVLSIIVARSPSRLRLLRMAGLAETQRNIRREERSKEVPSILSLRTELIGI